MMDYLITLITPFPRSHQSTNIIKGLFLCRNIIYPEWKRLWVSSLSSILVPKFGLTFLKNWNLFCHICLENNVKTSCCLIKIRVDFRFICLSLFRKIVLMSLFSLMFSPLQLLTPPTVDSMLFSHCFYCCLFAYFIWHWFVAFCYFSFNTCETSSIKNWFVLATEMSESLTHMVFANPSWFNMFEHDH